MIKWGAVKREKISGIITRVKNKIRETYQGIRNYIGRLLFPLYLFPIKIVTYTLYYFIKFLIKLVIHLIRLIILALIWPFQSFGNFFKLFFWGGIFLYFAFTEIRFSYLVEHYGGYNKFFCSEWLTTRKLKGSVVRIVGGLSEGSGFFIAADQILTNYHVIADEPSPKIIFPDGSFITPIKITANKDADVALLYVEEKRPELKLHFFSPELLTPNEPLMAAGYPLGTNLTGEVTISKGIFNSVRRSKGQPVDYLQTNINLIEGMSGGPLFDQCGEVVGVNTLGLAGISFFISSDAIKSLWPTFSEQDITKIKVDPSVSPEEAVKAFYTYLKARRMEEGFNLLSKTYLEKTNFQEWTSRFNDILDVQIFLTEKEDGKKDTVFIKFATKNWVNGEAEIHNYEGTWQTIKEDGVYKMLKSNIKEVSKPPWELFITTD